MTIDQIFESSASRKTVWSKRGEEISKREVSAVSNIQPRKSIEVVKESKDEA